MYIDLINTSIIIYLFIVSIFVLSLLLYFIDKWIYKKFTKSNYDNLLINIVNSVGVFSAILFFMYQNILTLPSNDLYNYFHNISRLYMSFAFVYLLSHYSLPVKYRNRKINKKTKQLQQSSSIGSFNGSKYKKLLLFLLFILFFCLFTFLKIF